MSLVWYVALDSLNEVWCVLCYWSGFKCYGKRNDKMQPI